MALEDVLGLNARNFSYIRACNPREVIRLVDNKLKTKRVLKNAGLPVPETYKVFRRPEQVRNFDFKSLPNSFVVKPNSGFGGKGILVVFGRTKRGFLRSDGGNITEEQLKLHILNILEGTYSLSGLPDVAYIEERIKPHRSLRRLAYRGLPDIRIIVFNLVPVMAMLRVPTRESRGRSNLHENALGIGIDLASGVILDGFWHGRHLKYLPHTKIKLRGKKIKFWDEILFLATEAEAAVGGKFLGVDIALSARRGPIVLELNARPGLTIQNVNRSGLRERLIRVEKLKVEKPYRAVLLGKELFRISRLEGEAGERPVIGLVETVEIIMGKRREKELAKIDTGADICSIDFSIAENIGLGKIVKRARKIISLNPNFHESQRLREELKHFPEVIKVRTVKSSLGIQMRVMVRLKFKIAGHIVETPTYLTDRSSLRYKIIIGRLALKNFIVDPLKYTSKLRPFSIKKTEDVKPFFALFPRKVVGLAVNAFNRIGAESFVPEYTIAALKDNREDNLLKEEGIKIFSAEKEGFEINHISWNTIALASSPHFARFLEQLQKSTAWLVYAPKRRISKLASRYGAVVLANSEALYERLADKHRFRQILQKLKVPFPRGRKASVEEQFAKLQREFGTPFFCQMLSKGGGRGNFAISSRQEFEKMKEVLRQEGESHFVVSEFIEGFSPSITGCVTKVGTFYLPPQIQVLDAPSLISAGRGMGQFCGHDFSTDLLPNEVVEQAQDYVVRVGDYLRRLNYKGIFGLDFLWDVRKKRLLTVECNPRLLGVFPTQTIIQLSQGEIPLLMWHILEFLKAPYTVNYAQIQKRYSKPKKGAHLIFHNLEKKPVEIIKDIQPGQYRYTQKSQKLSFVASRHSFNYLNREEFLLTDGVPSKGRIIKPWKRMFRIITQEKVLGSDLKTLNIWARGLIQAIKKELFHYRIL